MGAQQAKMKRVIIILAAFVLVVVVSFAALYAVWQLRFSPAMVADRESPLIIA